MKAWMADGGSPEDGCLLVFAETRNKARYIATGFEFNFCDEYEYVRCRRRPEFDKWYVGKSIVVTNAELPDGCPAFYSEEDW